MILGGAQENTLLTVDGLSRKPGVSAVLVTGPTAGPEGELLEEAGRRGIEVILAGSLRRRVAPLRDLGAYRELKKIIGRLAPDVVHTHSSKAGILGREAAHALRIGAITHTIHGLPFHPYQSGVLNALYITAERRAGRYCRKIIAVADAMARGAVEARIGPREKFVTIYSGMEVEPFLAGTGRRAVRERLGIGPDELVIGKIARLFHLKGHRYVLDAAPRILEVLPNARFLFVGDGVLREELAGQARRLGVDGRVIFAGLRPQREIPELLSAMDVLVHASLREGLARSIPQAMLSGLPVVSFDIDGAGEVVIDGKTGCLVRPQDVGALADATVRLLTHPEQARAMGREGRELCRDKFRADAMVDGIYKLYEELLN